MRDEREWLRDRRARGYLRVSDKRQADKFGPDSQRRVELEAAARVGLLGPSLFYEDHITGRDALRRSDFQRMVADAVARQFDVLVVGRVDRFARNEEDAWEYLKKLRLAGVAVYFCEEDVLVPRDDDWQGRVGGEINAAAAYSRRLSKNIRAGLAAKRARGGYAGGMPATYRYSDDKMRLEPTDATPVRLEAWALYGTGEFTFATLATEMNRRGHTIRTRGQVRLFTKYTIEEIFKTAVDLEVGGLPRATFDRVREIMAARAGAAEKRTLRRHEYVFASLARCGDCGEKFWGRTQTTTRGRPYPQLYHAPRGCRRGAVSEDKLSATFGDWLATWRLSDDTKARLVRWASRSRGEDLRFVRRRQIERELDQLGKQHRWGHVADDEYLLERRRLTRAIDELAPEPTDVVPSAEILRAAAHMRQVWDDATGDMRRRFLHEWFERIVLTRNGLVELHARGPYKALVLLASEGDRRVTSSTAHRPDLTISVAGLADWQAFWASEATA